MRLLCPRCGQMFEHPLGSALSRYHEGVRICSKCGVNEAIVGDWWDGTDIVTMLQKQVNELEGDLRSTERRYAKGKKELAHFMDQFSHIMGDRRRLKQQVVRLSTVVQGLVFPEEPETIEEKLTRFSGKAVTLSIHGRAHVGELRPTHLGLWTVGDGCEAHPCIIDDVREFEDF